MSKSYRKPYGTFCSVKGSEHDLKTLCSRIWRRAQNQAVREAFRDDSWDEFTLPIREEGKLGSEYDLRRDGRKRPMHPGSQYNNPYAYTWLGVPYTEEDIFLRWGERKQRDDEFMADIVRK